MVLWYNWKSGMVGLIDFFIDFSDSSHFQNQSHTIFFTEHVCMISSILYKLYLFISKPFLVGSHGIWNTVEEIMGAQSEKEDMME